jgi:hypothetical protein
MNGADIISSGSLNPGQIRLQDDKSIVMDNHYKQHFLDLMNRYLVKPIAHQETVKRLLNAF